METFKSVNITEAFRIKPIPLDFVFGSMKAGTIGAIVAPGATGKSVFALQVLSAVSSGYDNTGVLKTKTVGKCVYLSGEDTPDIINHRLYSLGQSLPVEVQKLMAENAQIIPVVGTTPDILNQAWQDILIAYATGTRLLVIDTLRRFHSGDENDSGQMTRVIQALEHVAITTGCAIIFLHHTSKAALTAGSGEQGASRGSSAITDNIRWQANLAVMSEPEAEKRGIANEDRKSFVKFTVSKSNYGTPIEAWLRRAEGGILTPAVVPEPAPRKAKRRVEEPVTNVSRRGNV